ncbi:DUF2808 domain-containing protein [Gloeocapsopsis crepidinum]|nr:DUF2808 domain-containing protein [Gloeocapsopsis crepidinum]
MVATKVSMRRVISALAVSGCLIAAFPVISTAQSLPGFTIFSGVKRENQLPFRLDFGGQANGWDRYRLRIPGNRLNLAAAQFTVSYPENYRGKFDPDNIEVRVRGKSVPLQEVRWDQENRVVEIFPAEPVPANTRTEIVFSNVRNPTFGGMYYFNCQIQTPGDVPLLRYVGTWILSIS